MHHTAYTIVAIIINLLMIAQFYYSVCNGLDNLMK